MKTRGGKKGSENRHYIKYKCVEFGQKPLIAGKILQTKIEVSEERLTGEGKNEITLQNNLELMCSSEKMKS